MSIHTQPPPLDETAPLVPNKNDIAAHLCALFPPAFVQAYPDSWIEIPYGLPDGKLNMARTFPSFDLEDAAQFAIEINAAGYNVYVGAALRHGQKSASGRANGDNVLDASHAWAEYDGAGDDDRIAAILKANNLTPSLIITTGTTPDPRRHVYFRLDGSVSSEKLQAANESLMLLLSSDDVRNADRVMRLAGTVNYPSPKKRQQRGYITELTSLAIRKDAPAFGVEELIGLTATPANDDDVASGFDRTNSSSTMGWKFAREDGEIQDLLEASSKPGNWHNSMRAAVASMIGRGWTDFQIKLACTSYCTGGFNDPDLQLLIDSGRKKFDKRESPDTNGPADDDRPLIVSSAGFLAGFVPPDYLIDGILQRRFCYSMTAPTAPVRPPSR
jgi:hypothetical protein